jgi:hypothetical protein
MSRRGLRVVALLVGAAAALPGCISVIVTDDADDEETPTGKVLTQMEHRMDRIEQHAPAK